MSRVAAIAALLPLMWAQWYTAGLPASLRERRLAEIRSDTYEHANDPELMDSPARHAWDITQSFIRGLPDDLRWRAVNTPAGRWILETVSLSIALATLGTAFALVQTDQFTGTVDRIGVGMTGFGLGLAVGLWCAAALRSNDSDVVIQTPAAPDEPEAGQLRGDSMALTSFARWAGWFLVASGILQVVAYAAGAAGGYDYFAGTERLLDTIADEQSLFAAALVVSAPIAALLIPLFIYLVLAAPERQRARPIVAASLLGIYVGVSTVALALFAVLLPIADDFAGATGATAETLETQARGFLQLRFILIQPAGVAMTVALALAVYQMRTMGLAPRWLTVVGFVLAASYLPPIAGEFIVTYPLFLVWTIATGLLLLRRNSETAPMAAPLPA